MVDLPEGKKSLRMFTRRYIIRMWRTDGRTDRETAHLGIWPRNTEHAETWRDHMLLDKILHVFLHTEPAISNPSRLFIP